MDVVGAVCCGDFGDFCLGHCCSVFSVVGERRSVLFFFVYPATTDFYGLSLHGAFPLLCFSWFQLAVVLFMV